MSSTSVNSAHEASWRAWLREGREAWLSELLPAFAIASAYSAGVFWLAPPACVLVASLSCGMVAGALFCTFFGPLLSWWRRALLTPRFLPASLALNVWVVAWMMALHLVVLEISSRAEGATGLLAPAWTGVMSVLACGLLGCSVVRGQGGLAEGTWGPARRFLSVVTLLVFLGVFARFGHGMVAGGRFDPDLTALRDEYGWAKAVFTGKAEDGPPLPLPEGFRSCPELRATVLAMRHARTVTELPLPALFEALLREMRPRLQEPEFWHNLETVALARVAWYFDPGRAPKKGWDTTSGEVLEPESLFEIRLALMVTLGQPAAFPGSGLQRDRGAATGAGLAALARPGFATRRSGARHASGGRIGTRGLL